MAFTVLFGLEAGLKILAFTFRTYIASGTNQVGAPTVGACCMARKTMIVRGAVVPSSNPCRGLNPNRHSQVDLLIVITSAMLLGLESVQIEAIKVRSQPNLATHARQPATPGLKG